MVLLAAPLILLYFIAGAIAVQVDKQRDKKQLAIENGSMEIDAPTSIKD
jgi:Sec-independent protein secretion pathway component TatC